MGLAKSGIKSWIVYRKPDGQLDAVENDHKTNPDHDQVQELHDEGNVIMGFNHFIEKIHAIQWVQQFEEK